MYLWFRKEIQTLPRKSSLSYFLTSLVFGLKDSVNGTGTTTASTGLLEYFFGKCTLYCFPNLPVGKPLLLISISFVVTGYVAKFKRNENFFKTIFIAITIGFILFLIDKVIYSINIDNTFSYLLITITIPIISLILGTILMLKIEKG